MTAPLGDSFINIPIYAQAMAGICFNVASLVLSVMALIG
jgi:hypothetical protein